MDLLAQVQAQFLHTINLDTLYSGCCVSKVRLDCDRTWIAMSPGWPQYHILSGKTEFNFLGVANKSVWCFFISRKMILLDSLSGETAFYLSSLVWHTEKKHLFGLCQPSRPQQIIPLYFLYSFWATVTLFFLYWWFELLMTQGWARLINAEINPSCRSLYSTDQCRARWQHFVAN